MITWGVMLVLAAGVYGQRLAGYVVADGARELARWRHLLDAVPLAIIAAVIALQVMTSAGSLEFDARLAGLAAAGLCLWRRLPLAVVVFVAAAVTALLRLAT